MTDAPDLLLAHHSAGNTRLPDLFWSLRRLMAAFRSSPAAGALNAKASKKAGANLRM